MRIAFVRLDEVMIGVFGVPSRSAPGTLCSPLAPPKEGPFLGITKMPGLFVASGTTLLRVHELQPAGKKRMSAVEFLSGYPIQEGYHFGPEKVPS